LHTANDEEQDFSERPLPPGIMKNDPANKQNPYDTNPSMYESDRQQSPNVHGSYNYYDPNRPPSAKEVKDTYTNVCSALKAKVTIEYTGNQYSSTKYKQLFELLTALREVQLHPLMLNHLQTPNTKPEDQHTFVLTTLVDQHFVDPIKFRLTAIQMDEPERWKRMTCDIPTFGRELVMLITTPTEGADFGRNALAALRTSAHSKPLSVTDANQKLQFIYTTAAVLAERAGGLGYFSHSDLEAGLYTLIDPRIYAKIKKKLAKEPYITEEPKARWNRIFKFCETYESLLIDLDASEVAQRAEHDRYRPPQRSRNRDRDRSRDRDHSQDRSNRPRSRDRDRRRARTSPNNDVANELAIVLHDNLPPTETQGSERDKSKDVCFGCGKTGHWARNCPTNPPSPGKGRGKRMFTPRYTPNRPPAHDPYAQGINAILKNLQHEQGLTTADISDYLAAITISPPPVVVPATPQLQPPLESTPGTSAAESGSDSDFNAVSDHTSEQTDHSESSSSDDDQGPARRPPRGNRPSFRRGGR
jgi:hypothetical protein